MRADWALVVLSRRVKASVAGADSMAAWFETRGVARLLTMGVQDLIQMSAHLRASRRMKPPDWKTH